MKKKKNIVLLDPTSFTVYDLNMNGMHRRIVVIGEIHDIKECSYMDDRNTTKMSIAQFIEEYHMSIGSDKVLDIFSESLHVGGKRLGWLATIYYMLYNMYNLNEVRALAYIRKRLDPCSPKYNFSFYECPENLRIHLCDVRFMLEMNYDKKNSRKNCRVDTLFKIGMTVINPEKIPRMPGPLNVLISFVQNFLLNKKSPEYHRKLTAYIIKETKIYKQIRHIQSAIVRRKLSKWFRSVYNKRIKRACQCLKQFIKIYKSPPDSMSYVPEIYISEFLNYISINILYIISVFMDMYLMSRLLRRFSDNTYAENSIIYVGEYHAEEYMNVLELLGAKKIFHTNARDEKKNDRTCNNNRCNYSSCVNIAPFYYTQMVKIKDGKEKK